jgi:hypothetical protein
MGLEYTEEYKYMIPILRSMNHYIRSADFINKAHAVHDRKYNYAKVFYVDTVTKVTIICSEHGEFEQRPAKHLAGHGCAECGLVSHGSR